MYEHDNEITSLHVGDIVNGIVVKIEEKQVLVDIGYKTEGIIPISELSNLHVEKTSDVVSEGDELVLKVKKAEDDDIVLSKKAVEADKAWERSEEHTSELQSRFDLVCRLLLEKKKKNK